MLGATTLLEEARCTRKAIRGTCAASSSPAWPTCRAPDERDVAGSPEALRPWRLSRHGRRRRVLTPLGEGGLGSPLARDLAGRGARAAPSLGGLANLHRVGIAAALRRADLAARRRRPRATTGLLLVSRAARAAEGRAGVDVPLRHRLER